MSDNALFSLTGQVAVVIGGGGVLAGAMATGLAQAGAEIAILDVSQDGAEARARAIEELGCAAIGVGCDATSQTRLAPIGVWRKPERRSPSWTSARTARKPGRAPSRNWAARRSGWAATLPARPAWSRL